MISTHTLSCWTDAAPDFSSPTLHEHLVADVCIIGAGIAGLTTAYLLAREGCQVVVLDARHPTAGETERTTAHLANAIDDRFYNLERWHGPSGARLAAESHTFAIARIERIVSEEQIDCDFRRVDGYLFCGDDDSPDRLRAELLAARRAGLFDVTLLDPAGAPHPLDRTCLRFPRQAQFDPLRYAHGLTAAIHRLGGKIYGGTRVTDVEEGDQSLVQTEGGATVRAGALAVMTNSPINNRVALHTKLAPYRTYVVAGYVPSGSVPAGLFWDTNDPYHYVRTASGPAGQDLLIVGGEDHKTGQEEHNEAAFEALEKWAHEHFPMLGVLSHRWSGQVMETIDGLAFIGRNPGSHPNCFVATGDSGMGMTHGTLAGIIVADLIQGRTNPWAELYDPSRKTLSAALTFAEENLNVARQYLDWGRPHADDDVSDLPALDGRVVQRGGHKVAVHRDAEGRLHERSAVCRHLGCIVAWNEVEHTWDCPCHGSRFEPTGEVINGPAMDPLAAIDTPAAPSPSEEERSSR